MRLGYLRQTFRAIWPTPVVPAPDRFTQSLERYDKAMDELEAKQRQNHPVASTIDRLFDR